MKKVVQFEARDGSCMSLNFEVTDATGAICVQIQKGADTGAMTTFKLHGGGEITTDAGTIKHNMKILDDA